MRPVILLLTASLDGYIADSDGGVDWLAGPPSNVLGDGDPAVTLAARAPHSRSCLRATGPTASSNWCTDERAP